METFTFTLQLFLFDIIVIEYIYTISYNWTGKIEVYESTWRQIGDKQKPGIDKQQDWLFLSECINYLFIYIFTEQRSLT